MLQLGDWIVLLLFPYPINIYLLVRDIRYVVSYDCPNNKRNSLNDKDKGKSKGNEKKFVNDLVSYSPSPLSSSPTYTPLFSATSSSPSSTQFIATLIHRIGRTGFCCAILLRF
jgi:hypothetical protein